MVKKFQRFLSRLSPQDHLRLIRADTILSVLLATVCLACPSYAQDEAPKKVLVLHSYHHGYKWTDDIAEGLKAAFSESPLRMVLYVEHMDTKRTASYGYYESLATFYHKKYYGQKFDIIVCSDNNAVEFMSSYGRKLFPDIPVVFCGFNFLREKDLIRLEGFTGVNEEADLKAGLDLAMRIHPDTTTIYVINDRTPTGARVMGRLREITSDYADRTNFVFLDNLAMQDLLVTLRSLSPGDLVFYTFFFRDQSNRFFEYDESIRLIAESCPVPIYGAWDFSLGNGIVGGLLTSGYHQGQAAGQLALEILNGKSTGELPVVFDSPNHYMFDDQYLKKFKIDRDRLPADAILINKPPSIYHQYRHAVLTGLAAFAFQLCIIFFLTISIVRRRRVEKTILQSGKRLNMILETANEGFWEISPGAIGLNVNAELCRILNRTREQIVGHSIFTFTDDANRSIFETHLAKRRHGKRSQYEIALQKSDGKAIHCQFNSSPLFDEQGRFIGSFAMVTDISQRKRSEKALRKREAMLRALFEATDNAIVVVSATGHISQMNDRFSTIFPMPKREDNNRLAPPMTFKDLLKPHIAQREIPDHFNQPSIASQKKITSRIRCRNGRVIDVSCYPLQLDKDRNNDFVFNFRDITENIRLESQLLQSQKMEALGTLTSGIAHDFNNILAAILGYAEILKYQFKDRPNAIQKISRILKASHRAKALVQQIHSFSRPQHIEPRAFPAGLIVKEVVKLLQASIPSDISIQIDTRTKRDTVTVDPGQIHQVIMNLCTNAVHAMQDEGGVLTVILDNERFETNQQFLDIMLSEGTYLSLQVKDTGHGMSPELVTKIFDPYFTTKEKGRGTGLGLSVTLGIVKNHGGAIKVKSNKWHGTDFTVYLPLSGDAEPSKQKLPRSLPTGAGRIFLVDDEPDVIGMMKEMVLQLGYQATSFRDSQKALEAFEKHSDKFDLAVVDMAMPGLSGVNLAKALRRIRPSIPIILCTGYKDETIHTRDVKALFNHVLMKPLEMHTLAETMRRTLSKKP